MTRAEAEQFLADHSNGVLVTLKSDGRPQSSNIGYAFRDGSVAISVTDTRAKVANVRRDPRVSLHVSSDDFWSYVVAEGRASLSPVASQAGDETCRRLLSLYETIRGEPHPDPDEFFDAMVAEQRIELTFAVDHLYPVSD